MTVWYTYIGKVNFFYAEFFEQIISPAIISKS